MKRSPMHKQRIAMSLAFVTLVSFLSVTVQAADISQSVPDKALGYVVIRNLEATNANVEKLIKKFEDSMPGPLVFFKMATGFNKGLDLKGDALIALLPPKENGGDPGPMALFPVSDYEEFAVSVDADPTGEISLIQVAGEDLLLAKKDKHALLMNPEYRDEMEAYLEKKSFPKQPLVQYEKWMSSSNITFAILPAGVKFAQAAAKSEAESDLSRMEKNYKEWEMEGQIKSLQNNFKLQMKFIKFLGDEIQAAAYGATIDDTGNIKMGLRVQVSKTGIVSRLSKTKLETTGIAKSLPGGPFVMAGSGPWPAEWTEALGKYILNVVENNSWMFDDASKDDEEKRKEIVDNIEILIKNMAIGLKANNFSLQVGEDDDPAYSNIYSTQEVENVEAYLKGQEKVYDVMNFFMEMSGGPITLEYEVSEITIAGKPGLKVELDILAAMGQNAFPPMQTFAETMFGEDGVFRMYYAVIDDKHILTGVSKLEDIEARVEKLRKGETDDAFKKQVAKTDALLPENPTWSVYLSPSGGVNWARRIYEAFKSLGAGGSFEMPEYPTAPPVGFTLRLTENGIEMDAAAPVETIDGLSEFVQKVKDEE